MASWNLPRFASIETLQQIRPDRLLSFLRPHRAYFQSREVTLPISRSRSVELDYPAIVRIFQLPDANMPPDLIEGLVIVDELATAVGADRIREERLRRGLTTKIPADATPADIVLETWMREPEIAMQVHAEMTFLRSQKYQHFQVDRWPRPEARTPMERDILAMTRSLDKWFESRGRGRAVRILWGQHEDTIWFAIRRGELLKREEIWVDGASRNLCYRPIKYDRIIYTPNTRELAIHADLKGEVDCYCCQFGFLLFEDEEIFPPANKYTLDPLREEGLSELGCAENEGLDWVLLREVRVYRPGDPWANEILKSNDVLRLLTLQERELPAGRIVEAKFQFKFNGSRKPRMVTIRPTNVARYTRTSDQALVERWLQRNGFLLPPTAPDDEADGTSEADAAPEPILDVAR